MTDSKYKMNVNDMVDEQGGATATDNLVDYIKEHIWAQLFCLLILCGFISFTFVSVYLNIAFDVHNSEADSLKYYLFLGTYLVSLILAFFTWAFFVRRIFRPLYEIEKAMSEIRDGNLYRTIDIKGNHEIWQFAKMYNEMASDLASQKLKTSYEYDERMKAVELKNAAERINLETAVNTSFLYEILSRLDLRGDTMSPMQRKNIIHRVSDILKYINPNINPTVNMGSEIDWIENYLYVKKYILRDLFDYDISIDDKFREWPCIKLFLLPFIDNCIDHAFENIKHGGMIKIFASEASNRLVLNIWDNGCGLSLDTKKKLDKTIEKMNSLDIQMGDYNMNIQKIISKLYYFYGDRLDIKILSDLGDGTCFTLILPLPNKFSWQGL